jgi:hypothetical protein
MFSKLGGLNTVQSFFSAFPYALIAALVLISNNPRANLLWQAFALLVIGYLNFISFPLLNPQVFAQLTLSRKVVSVLRAILLILLDLHFVVATIRVFFGRRDFAKSKDSAYLEYSRSALRDYRTAAAKANLSVAPVNAEEIPKPESPVFIPSVLIASCLSTFLLLIFTLTSVTQSFRMIDADLKKGLGYYEEVVSFFNKSEHVISDTLGLPASFQLNESVLRLVTLTKHFDKQVELLLEAGFEEDAQVSKALLEEFQPYLSFLHTYTASIRKAKEKLYQRSLDDSYELFLSEKLSNAYNSEAAKISGYLHELGLLLHSLCSSVIVSSKVASIVSFVIAALVIPFSLFSYKRITLELRKGKESRLQSSNPDVQKHLDSLFDFRYSPFLIGVQFSSAYVGFYLVFALVFSVIFFISWKRFWHYIDLNSLLVLFLQVLFVFLCVNVILVICVGRYLVSDTSRIKKLFAWNWFFSFALFSGFISGVLGAFVRFVSLVVISLFSLFRSDITLFPKRVQLLDVTYVAFMGFVLGQHRHDNPHVHAFLDTFKSQEHRESESGFNISQWRFDSFKLDTELGRTLADNAQEQVLKEPALEKRKRAIKRWRLAYSLVLDPTLCEYRRSREPSQDDIEEAAMISNC